MDATSEVRGRTMRSLVRNVKCWLLMAWIGRHGQRQVSAMVRVRNEEEFLHPSVQSIVDCVDEIVIVDNLSTDRSPLIIEALRREYPDKVVCYRYPYEVRRVGRENWELATSPEGASSPHLSANYYNWCMRRCTKPFILKWDGDMIATDTFHASIRAWRLADRPVMVFHGANVHSDMEHLIAAKSADREMLMSSLTVPGLPMWATSLTYDYPEPRLFPKFLARYDRSLGWTQRLSTPFRDQCGPRCCYRIHESCYLHLKFCKRDPYSGYSSDLKEVISSNVTVGPPLSHQELQLLRRWQLESHLESAGLLRD